MKHWKTNRRISLIELAAQHALNRAEIDVAKHYLEDVDATQLTRIRLQIAQFEGKKGVMDELESMLNSIDASDEKATDPDVYIVSQH